jgi:16S rRNA C967 or C1407 C5-methylase (RsmB/RsmF family)/NOL1/NOP2/fmu family ribosome biogenesis protein
MNAEQLFSRYAPIIPDFKAFMEFIHKPLKQSFRVNTLKAKKERILSLIRDHKIQPVPFYQDGFYLSESRGIGFHFTHAIGMIYAQEMASMVPALVMQPRSGEVILDLCASPGSKTTQISQMMGNTGLLVANEINPRRMAQLMHNVKRCGLINECIISCKADRLSQMLPDYFDRILIDAPCSLEGTIRKSRAVLDHWGLKNINRMAWIQKGLVVSGFRLNEAVIDYLIKKFPEAEIMPVQVPQFAARPGITKWLNETYDERVKQCARVMPQDNDTEPFFIAQITKRGVYKERIGYLGRIEYKEQVIELLKRQYGLLPEKFQGYAVFQNQDIYFISTPLAFSFTEMKTLRKGLEIGKIYEHELKPDNDFVQVFASGATRGCYAVKDWELKRFLKGDKITVSGLEPGFAIITHQKFPVGVGRCNGREIKSEILRERRIKDTG